MNRPPLEVADLVRAAGRTFIERSRKWITRQHLKVLRAIARCRTAALGGHLDECTDCAYRPPISYNSCRDRHCPKCQANARDRWLQARRQELLPTRYVHVVLTLSYALPPLALQNKKILYHLLLQTSAETLLEVARDPQHFGAEIGFLSVLHTWNQKLEHHPHAHCVVPAGGLSPDHSVRVSSHARFFLPIPVLRKVFRRKFVSALKRNFRQGKLGFHGTLKPLAHPKAFSAWLRTLYRHHWHVYSKPPFGDAEQAVRYLGHYTHRVAISNHRLVSLIDDQVTFCWRDRAHNNQEKLLPLSLDEFLRRFLLHLLPKGFVRIRHFGFLANRRRRPLSPRSAFNYGSSAAIADRTRSLPCPGTEPTLALSQMWRKDGDHRETYCCPTLTPLSTLSPRSRRMIRQFRSRSLGASHHLPACCALLAPKSATRFQPRLKLLPPSYGTNNQTHPPCPHSSLHYLFSKLFP